MSEKSRQGAGAPEAALADVDDAARTHEPADFEDSLRERVEDTELRVEDAETSLRDRFGQPIARATELTKATLAWFPVRVWRHFLQHNGFLLSAGVSYQALFAVFAAIYVAFAAAGIWLGGSPAAVNALITLINGYIPGLISESGGVITPEEASAIASDSASGLVLSGLIALGALVWTAIGWVTFARRAVRDAFGLARDQRNYFFLKARDLLAALMFGVALLVGGTLSAVGSIALDNVLGIFDVTIDSSVVDGLVRVGTGAVSLALNTVALAALFRFLTGASLSWRAVWPGALVGGGALTVLQLGTGLLLRYTPSNPLLVTFAFFVGLLLWFRLQSVVMLIAASWVAIAAVDKHVPLTHQSDAERAALEHQALKIAANVHLRDAHAARERAPWYRVPAADRALRAAEAELERLEASTPAPGAKPSSLFE
ncbi:MAG: YihY/virulence factor BrkB family protein [Microbacteriaceae bacterium]